MRDQNVELLRGHRVIVVNSSYQIAPWADFLFFGDSRWWRLHGDRVKREFKGRIVTTCSVFSQDRNMLLIVRPAGKALSADPGSVAFSRTSTQGAINLAVHLGVKRIVLLGVDQTVAQDGITHHHAKHPWPLRPGGWGLQMEHLRNLAEPLQKLGVEVINTSPVSKIDWWPKRSLEDCL